MTKRTENVTIRVFCEDKVRYREAARERGLTLSRWIRSPMDGKRMPARGELKAIRQLIGEVQGLRFQIAQIGKNLNQLLKLLHSRRVQSTQGQAGLLDGARQSCDAARAAVEAWDLKLYRRLRDLSEGGGD